MNDIEESKKDKEEDMLPFLKWAQWIFVIWVVSAILIKLLITGEDKQGQFGDMFGAVNSLFSGLALAGLIYTILLQRETIIMQKDELQLQRDELKETRKEFNIQNDTLRKQRFENTFFQMLSLHNELLQNFSLENDRGLYESRGVLQYLKGELKGTLIEDRNNRINNRPTQNLETHNEKILIHMTVTKFLESYGDHLEHYMQNLFQIIKLIHQTDLIQDPEKPFYMDILKAQFASYELELIFYLSIVNSENYPNLNPLVKDYNFFERLSEKQLVDKSHLNFKGTHVY